MGEIITFYSYKGGAGRSMALANVGVLLAQWGYKVLVVDLDLEAPGLENFFSSFIDVKRARQAKGVVEFLLSPMSGRSAGLPEFRNRELIQIPLPRTAGSLNLWTSGRRDQGYFKRVRELDFAEFYSSSNGGAVIEELRHELKSKYDFVLLDSRTGLTELGGLSTVHLPDYIVLLFTATEQAVGGGIDIVERAATARQRLPYPRPVVRVLPVPSRIDVQGEFRLSQRWLDRCSRDMHHLYESWLPRTVRPRAFLDLTKIPHVSYFSYGETLPVIEQGTTDPAGLGYAYENLAGLIAHKLEHVELLVESRDEYVKEAMREVKGTPRTTSEPQIFISYHHRDRRWLDLLRMHLAPLTRSRALILWDDTRLEVGDDWRAEVQRAIDQADVAVLLVSPDYLASPLILEHELPLLLDAAQERGLRVLWLPLRVSLFDESAVGEYQALGDPARPLSSLKPEERDAALVDIARRIAEVAGRRY